jgi:hypothetical protein
MCCPAGQAVLALPLKNADLSIKLPPGLHLAATAAGHLDCRMQLLSLQLDWPPAGRPSAESLRASADDDNVMV